MTKKKELTNEQIDAILYLKRYGWGGALSGGMSGAGTGASIGGSIGTLVGPEGTAAGAAIGAGIGLIAGGITGNAKENEEDRQQEIQARNEEMQARTKSFNMRDDGTGNWNAPLFAMGGEINGNTDHNATRKLSLEEYTNLSKMDKAYYLKSIGYDVGGLKENLGDSNFGKKSAIAEKKYLNDIFDFGSNYVAPKEHPQNNLTSQVSPDIEINNYMQMSPEEKSYYLKSKGYDVGVLKKEFGDSNFGSKSKIAEKKYLNDIDQNNAQSTPHQEQNKENHAPDIYGLIPADYRMYIKNLISPNDTIRNDFFTKDELANLKNIYNNRESKNKISYADYNSAGVSKAGLGDDKNMEWKRTLGRAKINNNIISDRYNFNVGEYTNRKSGYKKRLSDERSSGGISNLFGTLKDAYDVYNKDNSLGQNLYNIIRSAIAPHYNSVDLGNGEKNGNVIMLDASKFQNGGDINNLQYQSNNNILNNQNNGMVNTYSGQTHQGPTGGIPVDETGTPSVISKRKPVALTENGEVSYNGYVFSNRLKMNKGKTFADAAKSILSKYKTRLGEDYSGHDILAQESLKRDMSDVMKENDRERVRDQFANGMLQHKLALGGPINDSTSYNSPQKHPAVWVDAYGKTHINGVPSFWIGAKEAGKPPLVSHTLTQNDITSKKTIPNGNINSWGGWDTVKNQENGVNYFSNQYNSIQKPQASPTVTQTNPYGVDKTERGYDTAPNYNIPDFFVDPTKDITSIPGGRVPNETVTPYKESSLYSDNVQIDDLPKFETPKEYTGTKSKFGMDKIGAGIAGLSALSNVVRGLTDKSKHYNPEAYMVDANYSPILMRNDEARKNAREAYADRMRIADSMSPEQAAKYQAVSEASSQDRLAGINERIFNTNAQQLNRADLINRQTESQNIQRRLQINNINDQNDAAKDNLVTTGISQLGQIGQGIMRDAQTKANIDQYSSIMKSAQDNNNKLMKRLYAGIYPNADKKVVNTQPENTQPENTQINTQQEKTVSAQPATNGFDLGSYKTGLAKVESNNNPDAKNPNSSASGLYQITDSTWFNTYNQLHPNSGLDKSAILALKSDKGTMEAVTNKLTSENVTELTKHNIPVNNTNVYLMHFFGGPTGIKFLGADDNAKISTIVDKNIIDRNPQLKGKTVGEIKKYYHDKFNGGTK